MDWSWAGHGQFPTQRRIHPSKKGTRYDKGNLIESDDISQFEDCADYWDYRATVSVPAGTSIRVYATTIDDLLGMGAFSESRTIM